MDGLAYIIDFPYRDAVLYLVPSAVLACVIRILAMRYPIFVLLLLAGTICHEFAHFIAGLLTGAEPTGLTIIPRRTGRSWQLGSVALAKVHWYNAAPAALAPILIVLVPVAVAWWRTRHGLKFETIDIALAFAIAPQFISCWPSWTDWKIASRSWPYLVLCGVGWWMFTALAQ